MSTKKWIDSNNICTFADIPAIYEKLPTDVYELKLDQFKHEFFLERLFHKFILPEKIYDLEKDLIFRVQNTFNKYNKNFGILLKGTKGTGKTIAAKIISNQLELPVILITTGYTDMGNFINSINQDVIVLFDEFEKMYRLFDYEDESEENAPNLANLMTLMDGVFTSDYKRLFILTTNKEYIPDAMIARPSRIRYIKDFTDLSSATVASILNDVVTNKTLIPGLINMIKRLEIITIDIVKSMAEEANLYNTADPEFFSIFNVKKIESYYQISQKTGEKIKIISERIDSKHLRIGYDISTDDGSYVGAIKYVDFEKAVITVHRLPGNTDYKKTKTYQLKKTTKYHASYNIAF